MEDAPYGLIPISPVIEVAPVAVMAVSARITKSPADKRSTGNGLANPLALGTGAKTPVNMDITKDSATSTARTLFICSSSLGCAASNQDDGDARGHKPTQILVYAESADDYPM